MEGGESRKPQAAIANGQAESQDKRLFCFATHGLHIAVYSSVQTRTGITWLDKHTLNLMDSRLVAVSVHMCHKRVTQHSLENT